MADVGTITAVLGAIAAIASSVYLGVRRGQSGELESLRETLEVLIKENIRLGARLTALEKDRIQDEERIEALQAQLRDERRHRWKYENYMWRYESTLKLLMELLERHDISVPDQINIPELPDREEPLDDE